MEHYHYNKEFNNQMIDIVDGHTQNYFNLKEDIITFKNFNFFYEFIYDENDKEILRDCYIKFSTNGQLIIKKKNIDINLSNELSKINKFLFENDNIEKYKKNYNDINYYKQLIDTDIINILEDEDETIIKEYKDSLNLNDDFTNYIGKKEEELTFLHNQLKLFILLKQKIQDIYKTNINIYEDLGSKNDYLIEKQQKLLRNLVSYYKSSRKESLINDIYNLSRKIGLLNDNLVFLKNINKVGKIINKDDPTQIKVIVLFDDEKEMTVSIDDIEPYLSLSKNKVLIEKIYNNITITKKDFDLLKQEAGIEINMDSYNIDVNESIEPFTSLTDIKSIQFKESLPNIDGLDKNKLQNIIINIYQKIDNNIKRAIINNKNYIKNEEELFMYNMKNSLTIENILPDEIVKIQEYPKKENIYDKLSLFYQYEDGIYIDNNLYPTIIHYLYSNGVYEDYKEKFFLDSEMGKEGIKDNFRWGYHIQKIMNKKDPSKYGIKKNKLIEQDYFNNLKEVYHNIILENIELQDILKSTGDKYLLYTNKENKSSYLHGIHSKNNIYGFNLVGKYLMEIRDELLNIPEIKDDIEIDDNIELPYYKNVSNLSFDYNDRIISNYYLSKSIDKSAGSYYIEVIEDIELKEFLDTYTKIGLYRYLLNDCCDIRTLSDYGIVIEPFEFFGRKYNSINHAIMGIKYTYYNNPYLSPYYTKLIKDYGKSFSIPNQDEVYDYNNYSLNSIEILNLKPPININSIPDYWKKNGDNDIEIGSILHKYLLFNKFTLYPIFNSLILKLQGVVIYDEIKNTILIKNMDLMEVINTINSGIVDCYFTNVLEYITNNKEEYYESIIFTIINNLLHKNKLDIIENTLSIYNIITPEIILEKIDIYSILKSDILPYLSDNFVTILEKTFNDFIQNSHYEFIGYIRKELKSNDNNLSISNKELILSILKLLENDDKLDISNIEDSLNKFGIFYKLSEDSELSQYSEPSLEIKDPVTNSIENKLILERDNIIEIYDGIDYDEKLELINKNTGNYEYYWGIKEYPVENSLINLLSIIFDYRKDKEFCDCNTPIDVNVKYPSEEEETLNLYYNRVLNEIEDNTLGLEIIKQYKDEKPIDNFISSDIVKLEGTVYFMDKDFNLYDDIGMSKKSQQLHRDSLILIPYGEGDNRRFLRLILIMENNDTGDIEKY